MRNGDYELIVVPDDWPGIRYRGRYCYEHKYVYWKNTGIIPTKNKECIHHLNENRRDNRFENLELTTIRKHNNVHNYKGRTVSLVCSFCGKKFERDPRNVNTKRKRGQTNFFCNRVCGYKYHSNR